MPGTPGWSIANFYYHADASADTGDQFPYNARIRLSLDSRSDLVYILPAYTFPVKVFGGQAPGSPAGYYGHMFVGVDATLARPNGNAISGEADDTLWGFGGLLLIVSLKWNNGVNNTMAYASGNIPV